MKVLLVAFLLVGCAASSGSGGHVVGNGMASEDLANYQETPKKACKGGKKMGCGEEKKAHSH